MHVYHDRCLPACLHACLYASRHAVAVCTKYDGANRNVETDLQTKVKIVLFLMYGSMAALYSGPITVMRACQVIKVHACMHACR